MKKITNSAIAVFVLLSTAVNAQQIPLYSNYFFTPYIYNPATSGMEQGTEITMLHRRQWTDMQGSPETSALGINAGLNNEKVGWSVYGFSDKANIISRIGIFGNYAYHLQLNSSTTLSFGLGAGYVNNTIDQEAIRAQDLGDVFTIPDTRRGVFDINAGLNLQVADLTIGVSAPQLLAETIDFTDEETNVPVNFGLIRHYTFNARYDFKFDGDKKVLSPMVMVLAADDVPARIDVGAMFQLTEFGHIGAMFRSDYAITANIGVNLTEAITFGYAYDFSTNDFASSLGTSHEFMLTYRFGNSRENDRIENEIKRLKRQQQQQRTETEDIVDEQLQEFKESYKRELEEQVKEATQKEREELQRQIDQNRQNNAMTGGGSQPSGNQGNANGKGNQAGGAGNRNPVNQNTGNAGTVNQGGTASGGSTGGNTGGYDASNQASNVTPGSPGYYVVAGVFSSQANASKLVNRLSNQGYSSRYFQDPSNNYYYVYLLKFANYQQADNAKASRLNGSYNGDLWIKIVK